MSNIKYLIANQKPEKSKIESKCIGLTNYQVILTKRAHCNQILLKNLENYKLYKLFKYIYRKS